MSWNTENREKSLAKTLTFEDKPQVNHLGKSRIIMELTLNLEEPLHLPQSKKMFACLELLFVSYISKNQLKVSINLLIFHLEIV